MHEELSTALPLARLGRQRAFGGSVDKCGLAAFCRRDRKKPDPFEPGGSGNCPKPPFQPLSCALFSWAFLTWAAALASPPAALGQPWLLP